MKKENPVIHEMIDNFYSEKRKNANKQKWYRNYMEYILSLSNFHGGMSKNRELYILSNAYHNKLTSLELIDFCGKSYIDKMNIKVDQLIHDDIISNKIKVVQGIELRKRNPQKILAINQKATSRKEKKHNEMLKEYVYNHVMMDVMKEMEQKKAAVAGQQMTKQQQQVSEEKLQEEFKAKTPEEVETYMSRDYSDPAEVQANQMANYIKKYNKWDFLTNNGWKEATISGYEIYLPEIINNKIHISLIDPKLFDYEGKMNSPYIHDASWQIAKYRMSISEMANRFRLTKAEIKKIQNRGTVKDSRDHVSAQFFFENEYYAGTSEMDKADIYHVVWRAPTRIGFLTYMNEEGELSKMKVSEDYEINHEMGDMALEWEYIHIPYEGWILPEDIYKNMKMSDNSLLDSEDPWSGAMPYVGCVYDHDYTGLPTSILSRGMYHQLMFNVFSTKLNNILKSDKGKKLVVNINSIPKSKGIGTKKFLEYSEKNDIIFVNPNEEGNKGLDVSNMISTVDLSLMSDIQKYIMLLDYSDRRCGEAMGINKAMDGGAGKDPVFNTKQAVVSSSNILEPYRQVHSIVKDLLLDRSIELFREAVRRSDDDVYIQNVLDDMSIQATKLDKDLVTSNNYGVFSADTTRASEIFEALVQLSHAAMQAQTANFSDVTAVLLSESIYEAKEVLIGAEKRKEEQQRQQQEGEMERLEMQKRAEREFLIEQHEREKELIILKEEEKRKTMEKTQLMESMGFAKDKDADDDGIPDVFEVYKYGIDADLKGRKQDLDEEKFEQEKVDKKADRNLKKEEIKSKERQSKNKSKKS